MAAPPDLRVLCRRLASTPVEDLPRLCPVLVSHVLRCGGPLSAPQDLKARDRSSEAPMLVHKFRTHITTHLTGKSPAGRFAAVCLIKAVIDVGGWETLRASDPWLKGLIGVLQKPDPLASKELCIVTLTKMYVLLQGYQTLVREMATPSLPSYVTACLQLIKPSASGRPLKVPAAFVDTVASSLSKLVVLYPTTLRPFAGQIKAALRPYIAPTWSDALLVPQTLKDSTRQLFILLCHTAPKNGSSEEWVKAIRSTILESHATVDQVFRAVVESWESATGYRSQAAAAGLEPSGGGESAEELPPWAGVQAGAERLIGLLDFLAQYFDSPTKAPVTVPLGEILDLAARITLVTAPQAGSEDSVETNPAISKDEKAELWSVLPDIHIAVLHLHRALLRRLGENAVPLATDILDQMVRVSTASRQIPSMRETAYALTKELLLLSGPSLPKLTVSSLVPLIQSSCHDILLTIGHGPSTSQQPATTTAQNNGAVRQPSKPGASAPAAASTNADAYLTAPSATATNCNTRPTSFCRTSKSPLLKAAADLLPVYFSHLPQAHLAPELRGLLDRTAILARHRDAMLASVLHPYRDGRGRYYPSILPFLAREFPRDQAVEVLRSNLLVRPGRAASGGEALGLESRASLTAGWNSSGSYPPQERGENAGGGLGVGGIWRDGKEEGEEEEMEKEERAEVREAERGGSVLGGWGVAEEAMDVDGSAADTTARSANPFAAVIPTASAAAAQREHAAAEEKAKGEDAEVEATPARAASPLKRKSDAQSEPDVAANPPKRVDTGRQPQVAVVRGGRATPSGEAGADNGSEGESDSEGSVQIDMTLDDDDDDEEEEEENEDDDEEGVS